METFGKRLIDALQRINGGNQSELARFAKVSPQAVQKWCSEKGEPRGKNLESVATYLNVTPEYLKFGSCSEAAMLALAPPPPPPPFLALTYADANELRLLTSYRESTDDGKHQLLMASEMTEKIPEKLLPAKLVRHNKA